MKHMSYDIVLAGVGGQGILSIAFILDNTALKQDFKITQGEIHGMAQKGGAVSAQVRLSTREIYSNIIPSGGADLILSLEPMETLRYLKYLKPEGGLIISSVSPVKNIKDYPDPAELKARLLQQPGVMLLDAAAVARKAGTGRAQNMVMLGAAAALLPLDKEVMISFIDVLFGRKGAAVIDKNRAAFNHGLSLIGLLRGLLAKGLPCAVAHQLMWCVDPATLTAALTEAWVNGVSVDVAASLGDLLAQRPGVALTADPLRVQAAFHSGDLTTLL